MTSERAHNIKEKAIEEVRSFLVMALYLWFVFALMLLNEAVILPKPTVNFLAQGFAVINAANREEAVMWVKKFMAVAGDGECEVRQLW